MRDPSGKPDALPGRWDFWVNLLLPSVTSLRQRLRIDEDVFRSHTFHAAPRDFVLWTALDEVGKTAMALIKLDPHLDDARAEVVQANDWIERASLSLILEEERLRARRLCELLGQLVLFSQNDEEAYYRHFLLLEEHVAASWYNENLETFHGARSGWVQAGIDRTSAEVAVVESSIDFDRAWYLKSKAPFNPNGRGGALSSARDRIKAALPKMTDFERLAMGSTYDEAFGQPSAAVHYRAAKDTGTGRATDITEVVDEGTKLGMLGFCVVHRCYMLLGRPTPSPAEVVARALEMNTEAGRELERLNVQPSVAVGDFVSARGYLGEVVAEKKSKFACRSLRVELIAERPQQDLRVDWFRARDVRLLFSRASLDVRVASAVGGAHECLRGRDDLRASVIDAWNHGLREQVRSQVFDPSGPPRKR